MKGTSCCVIKRNFSTPEPLDLDFRGHRSARFPLLSACRFAEFEHVFMHCLGSFLMQDMSPRICLRGTKCEIYREHVAYLHQI